MGHVVGIAGPILDAVATRYNVTVRSTFRVTVWVTVWVTSTVFAGVQPMGMGR